MKLQKALDIMRAKRARLVKTRDRLGVVYHLTTGERIDQDLAEKIAAHPQILPGNDGQWGINQTWGFD